MSEQDTLLDVVVNIKPNNDLQKALDTALKESLRSAGGVLSAFNLRVENSAKKLIEQLQQVITQFNAANAAFRSASQNVAAAAAATGAATGAAATASSPEQATTTAVRKRARAVSDETKQAVDEAKNSLLILRNATDDSLKSTRELLNASRDVVTENLREQIQSQITELVRLRTEIARDLQIAAKAPETAAAALGGFRERAFVMSNTGGQLANAAGAQAANRAELNRLLAEFKQQQQTFRIQEELARSQVRGLPSAGARAGFAAGKAEIAGQIQDVQRLAEAFDGTEQSVNAVRMAIQELTGTSVAPGSFMKQLERYQTAKDSLPVSMNTLRNNFYQLGQAFEDAGIGYELNGWNGAIRGASNNVLFLANSFIQTNTVQDKLTQGLMKAFKLTKETADTVGPLALGFGMVGLSIATIILPRMVEWLESLNDIDYQMKDLSETLRRQFEAQDFTINLRIGEEGFRRQLQDLSSVEEVLKRIRDLEAETADESQRMTKQMRGLFALGEFEDTITALQRISPAFQRQSDEMVMSRAREILDERTRLRFTLETEPSAADIRKAQQELSDLQQIRSALINLATGFDGEINGVMRKGVTLFDQLSESFEEGIFNPSQIRNVANQLRVLQEAIPTIELDAADEKTAENYTKTIEVLIGRLTELGNAAETNASRIGKNLVDAMNVAIQKTAELADRQALLRQQLMGFADEDATFLLDFRDRVLELQKLIDERVQNARDQKVPEAQVGAFEDALRRQNRIEVTNQLLQEQNRITDDIKKKEKELTDLVEKRQDRRSRAVQLEGYLRQLQENALSPDLSATKENTAAIQELTTELQRLRAQQEKNKVLEDLIQRGREDQLKFSASTMALLPGQIRGALPFAGAAATAMGFPMAGALTRAAGVEALAPVFDKVAIEIVKAVNRTTDAVHDGSKTPARVAP